MKRGLKLSAAVVAVAGAADTAADAAVTVAVVAGAVAVADAAAIVATAGIAGKLRCPPFRGKIAPSSFLRMREASPVRNAAHLETGRFIPLPNVRL